MPLQFYSTNGEAPNVDIKEALLRGQAPDGGLYMPEQIPRMDIERIAAFEDKPYSEIAFEVLRMYLEDAIKIFFEGVLPR